jgi:hypothetical protein
LNCFALLGDRDIMLLVNLPTNTEAIQVALAIARLTGASFSTYPAISMDEFDRIAEELATEIESARMEAGE